MIRAAGLRLPLLFTPFLILNRQSGSMNVLLFFLLVDATPANLVVSPV